MEVSQISCMGIFPFLTPIRRRRIMLSLQKVRFYSYGCSYIPINTSIYPYINISIFSLFFPHDMHRCKKLLKNLFCVFKSMHIHTYIYWGNFLQLGSQYILCYFTSLFLTTTYKVPCQYVPVQYGHSTMSVLMACKRLSRLSLLVTNNVAQNILTNISLCFCLIISQG